MESLSVRLLVLTLVGTSLLAGCQAIGADRPPAEVRRDQLLVRAATQPQAAAAATQSEAILEWLRRQIPGTRTGLVEVWMVEAANRHAGFTEKTGWTAKGWWFPTGEEIVISVVIDDDPSMLAYQLASNLLAEDVWRRLPEVMRRGMWQWCAAYGPGLPKSRMAGRLTCIALHVLGARLPCSVAVREPELASETWVERTGGLLSRFLYRGEDHRMSAIEAYRAQPMPFRTTCMLSHPNTATLASAWGASDPDAAETALGLALTCVAYQRIGFDGLRHLCESAAARGESQLNLASVLEAIGALDERAFTEMYVQGLDHDWLDEPFRQELRNGVLAERRRETGIATPREGEVISVWLGDRSLILPLN